MRNRSSLGLSMAGVALVSVLAAPTWARARVLVVGRDAPSVQAAIDAAADGDVVELPPGLYVGAVSIDRSITLRGRGATLDGAGRGTVVRVDEPGAVVEELTVRGSGSDLGVPDS